MSIRARVPSSLQPAARNVLLGLGTVTRRWRAEPSFIVIGGQRCGTTTVFKALAEHPQVLRPPVDKGTDYFSLYYSRGEQWYRGRMPMVASPTQRGVRSVAFEACTYYMFHPVAIERIARDLPDVKLVAMLRDPVERAYSAYKHELARGFEVERDFMRALELEDERLAGEEDRIRADVDYESFAHRHHAYRRRGQFAEQLRRVYDNFPAEQVHVIESESFFADPYAVYRDLVAFLQIDEWVPGLIDQHNARPGSAMPEQARAFLTEHYREHDAALADLLGRRPAWTTLT
jgi:hypothetical protein